MSFTVYLVIAYSILLAIDIAAFVMQKEAIGVTIAVVMVSGIAVLGYLWITSPM